MWKSPTTPVDHGGYYSTSRLVVFETNVDEDKIKGANHATDLGADYAEIRLVSETTNTASPKTVSWKAIPGQEVE